MIACFCHRGLLETNISNTSTHLKRLVNSTFKLIAGLKVKQLAITKMNGSFVGWSSPTANEEMHDASVVQQLARQKLTVHVAAEICYTAARLPKQHQCKSS